jgi:serine/threonine protein phosphatase PrpC
MARESTIASAKRIVTVTVTGVSDTGCVREINEDSFFAQAPIFAVADGMGGHTRGDLASRAVVESLAHSIRPGVATSPEAVFTALTAANAQIASWSEEVGIAGTTVAGLALVTLSAQTDLHWMAFNIGDSRVYLLDDGEFEQITVDHSAVQELLDQGRITSDEAERHPERNVVTRAVGVDADADADVWLLPTSGQQTFLICSDGLTREVSDDKIRSVLATNADDPASELLRLAIENGARDNVTVLVVRATTLDPTPPGPGYHENRSLGYLEKTLPRL